MAKISKIYEEKCPLAVSYLDGEFQTIRIIREPLFPNFIILKTVVFKFCRKKTRLTDKD